MDPSKLHATLLAITRTNTHRADDLAAERLDAARVRYLEYQQLLQEASALSCNGLVDYAHAASLHHALHVRSALSMCSCTIDCRGQKYPAYTAMCIVLTSARKWLLRFCLHNLVEATLQDYMPQ
ncbi:hypothetical protein DUNSADRAFT_18393 [Dunaliella salina]|uniref:Encoded protein n=1 Tax=Dunaliella salina TaxID=3046 RepID=A0ABQ7GZ17_DUNSA|nr:hypothetical protein DUNSADRAFT_18393 [Dunaliella salina]|eukprot:KAF5839850.1 hypothetical protein DUNSADRAFT_18393 [Dunaliella salina]